MRAYRFVGTVKNNRLWRAIVESFPEVKTQHDAALALGTNDSELGLLLNMKWCPLAKPRGRFKNIAPDHPYTPLARRLADALGESPDYLFAPELYAPGVVPRTFAFEIDAKPASSIEAPPLPDELYEAKEQAKQLESAMTMALAKLTPREQHVIAKRFGFNGPEQTLEEIAETMPNVVTGRQGINRERVRQVEAKALRKMRHPSRSKLLREHL